MNKKWAIAGVICLSLAFATSWTTAKHFQISPKLPNTLKEAAAFLEDDDFHIAEIGTASFTASTRPITADDGNLLSVHSPKRDWSTILRVSEDLPENDFPDHILLVRWGKMWVYGDPELVKRITRR